jgi:catalase
MKEPNTPKIDQLSEEAYVDPIGKTLTTLGVPVADNQNSLKINEKGPTLLEDFLLRDKLIHFDRERIPERVVHARGVGAHGYFQAYTGNEKWTKAKFLTDTNNQPLSLSVFLQFKVGEVRLMSFEMYEVFL